MRRGEIILPGRRGGAMERPRAIALALILTLTALSVPGGGPAGPVTVPAVAEEANATAELFSFDHYFTDYREYEQIYEEMARLAAENPEIVRLHDLAALTENGQTWLGRQIWALKISDGVGGETDYYDDPAEETVLIVGNHHAREWMSIQAPLYYAYYLTALYGAPPTDNDGDGMVNEDPLDGIDNDGDGEQGGRTDDEGRAMYDGIDNDDDGLIDEGIDEDPIEARVTYLVDNREIWIVPMLNPDGYVIDREGTGWRKNARDNNENDRFDPEYDGVDLNRNYPFEWSHNTQHSVITEGGVEYTIDDDNPGSSTYHGPQDDYDQDGDSFLGYDPIYHNPIYDPDGVDEDPEDVTHQDDDNDGIADEDRDGGFTEPETQVLQHLVWRLDIYDDYEPGTWPDFYGEADDGRRTETYRAEKHDGRHNIVTSISYHSYSALFIWPWGFKDEDATDNDLLVDLVDELMNWTGYGNWKEEGGYRVSGDMTDWLYGNQGVMAYTIELNTGAQGGFHPGPEYILPTCRMHLLSNMELTQSADQARIAKQGTYQDLAAARFPVLLHDQPHKLFYAKDDYPIKLDVRNADNLVSGSVKLYYQVNGGNWHALVMHKGATSDGLVRYTATIPGVDEESLVKYYFQGRDIRDADVYAGYGPASPYFIQVDAVVGFGNVWADALAVGMMMLVIYGVVWGGLYYTVNLATEAEKLKLLEPEG